MALEIERKFLVTDDTFKKFANEIHTIRQGYLSKNPERTVRIRILDDKAFITVKGITEGYVRKEFEYEIPYEDAVEMFKLIDGKALEKKRYIVFHENHKWEVDEFQGELYPLTVAEIELKSKDEKFSIPSFIGKEVTGNPDYYNSNLM